VSGATKQVLSLVGTLVLAFLVLEHYTGFSRDVSAISTGGVGIIKTLQGR
jgi:hypothetical protein